MQHAMHSLGVSHCPGITSSRPGRPPCARPALPAHALPRPAAPGCSRARPVVPTNRLASRLPSVACRAGAAEDVAAFPTPAKQAEVVKGCRMLIGELQAMDFARREIILYFQASSKLKPLPDEAESQGQALEDDLAAVRLVLDMLMKVDEDGDPLMPSQFKNYRALQLTQAELFNLWRWRRKGGGMDPEEQPHQAALMDIQQYKPEDIERITSSLLDKLDLSDAQKTEMSATMQGAALGAINGAVWGSLVASLAFLAFFNFFRGG